MGSFDVEVVGSLADAPDIASIARFLFRLSPNEIFLVAASAVRELVTAG